MFKLNVIDPLRFQIGCLTNGCSPSDLIILSTITKTGTHYLRMAIALRICIDDDAGETLQINPLDIDRLFPNNYHNHYLFPRKIKNKTSVQSSTPFFDLPRSHMPYQPAWKGVRVLHTYRHPINFITCCYLYKYNSDVRVINKKLSIEEVVNKHITGFFNEFESHRIAYEKEKGQIYRINFDRFVNDSSNGLNNLFEWLGMKTSYESCRKINEYIKSAYPNLYVGAGEAWMRNGKGKPSSVAIEQQNYFVKYNKFEYKAIWKPDLFGEINELGVQNGFERLNYE